MQRRGRRPSRSYDIKGVRVEIEFFGTTLPGTIRYSASPEDEQQIALEPGTGWYPSKLAPKFGIFI